MNGDTTNALTFIFLYLFQKFEKCKKKTKHELCYKTKNFLVDKSYNYTLYH